MARFRASFSSASKRYVEEVSFAGVDLTSPQMSVSTSRALDESNYVYRDSAIQKRYGFLIRDLNKAFYYYAVPKTEQALDTWSETDREDFTNDEIKVVTSNAPIYDMWFFNDIVIIHKGALLFYIKAKDIESETITPIAFLNTSTGTSGSETYRIYKTYEFPERKLSAFVSNNKLWILTGEYLMEMTCDSDFAINLKATTIFGNPYVPTTTIGIVQSQSGVSGSRMTYESPNMLTKERINSCVGGIENDDENDIEYSFYLDNEGSELKSVTINSSSSLPYMVTDHSSDNVFHYKASSYSNETDAIQDDFLMPRLPRNSQECFGIFPNSSNQKISFKGFNCVSSKGTILNPATTFDKDSIPAINIRTATIDEYFSDVTPDMTTSAELKKYNEGEYYVAIVARGNGYSTRIAPSNDLEWTINDLTQVSNPYYFNLIIYYMENDTIHYGTMAFKISDKDDIVFSAGSNVQSKGNVYLPIDKMDYAGNFMFGVASYSVKTNPSDTSVSRYTGFFPYAMIEVFGYTSSISSAFDKVGAYASQDIEISYINSTGETKANTIDHYGIEFRGNYYDTQLILEAVAPRNSDGTLRKFVTNSLDNGILALANGTPVATNDDGFYLIAYQDISDSAVKDNATIYGYVKYSNKDKKIFDKVVLYASYEGAYSGDSNIDIDFIAYYGNENDKDYIDYVSQINKCTFGIIFGCANYKDRLFVSGNSDYPTYDWHTGESDTTGEFNYFPSDSECVYGQDSAVAGYGIVSDGKMIVIKKPSDKETTVYYRTASYSTRKDDYGNALTTEGGETLYEELYPRVLSNSHIGATAQHLFCNYCGDTIFIDNKNRIVGLDNEGTTYDNQRIASTRSITIDKEIMAIDNPQDNCLLVQDGDELFYATPNCIWYSHYDAKYEWFRVSIKNVYSYAHIRNDDLDYQLFASKDGYIYMVKPNQFYDEHRVIIESGDIGKNTVSNTIKALMDKKEYTFYLKSGYTEYGTIKFYNDSYVYIPSDTTIYEKVIYLIGSDSLKATFETSNPDEVSSIPKLDGYTLYKITEIDGNNAYGTNIEIALYKQLSEVKQVLYCDDSNHLYSDKDLTSKIYISKCPYIYHQDNIYAFYITAPYLTNDLSTRKVVDQYTIVADTRQHSEIGLYVLTNHTRLERVVKYMGQQIDYNDVVLDGIDYMKYTLPHTQNVGATFYGQFLCFKIVSTSNTNSTLTRMQFVYHYSGRTLGRN